MICPRWLVQSSAFGVLGAALVAVPLWMNAAFDNEDQEPMVRHTSFKPAPHVADSDSEKLNAVHKARQDTQRAWGLAEQQVRPIEVRQVRSYRVEASPGPHCRDSQRAQALREVRILVEEGRENAEQHSIDGIDDVLSR